uniref:Uncharacterized protein n=1 Tax=Oryza meridionalis TaxID=40149 RepID=A0A0E0EKW9_9ORYZ
MADLVPISNRFTTNIQNAVTDAAGADKIEQNHLILVQIRNSLQAQNKSFPLLDPYLQVLDQPDNQSLAIFLSICDSDQDLLGTLSDMKAFVTIFRDYSTTVF